MIIKKNNRQKLRERREATTVEAQETVEAAVSENSEQIIHEQETLANEARLQSDTSSSIVYVLLMILSR